MMTLSDLFNLCRDSESVDMMTIFSMPCGKRPGPLDHCSTRPRAVGGLVENNPGFHVVVFDRAPLQAEA